MAEKITLPMTAGTYSVNVLDADNNFVRTETFTVTSVADAFNVTGNGQDAEITTDGTGTIQEIIYDGVTYTTDYNGAALTPTLFAAGTVFLTRPTVTGTAEDGGTMTGTPAVVVRADAPPGLSTFAHKVGGVVRQSEGLAYTLTALDAGGTYTFEQTVDGVTVASDAVSVASLPNIPVLLSSDGVRNASGRLLTVDHSIDMSGHNPAQKVIVFAGFAGVDGSPRAATNITLDGKAPTQTLFTQTNTASNGPIVAWAEFPAGAYSASSTLTLATTPTSTGFFQSGWAIFDVLDGATVSVLASDPDTARTSSDVSGNVGEDDAVIAFSLVRSATDLATWTGLTKLNDFNPWSGTDRYSAAMATALSEALPLAITVTHPGTTRAAAISLKVSV